MKLGMIDAEAGLRVVALNPDGQYVDLLALDAQIPPTLIGILADPEGLARVASALVTGWSKGPFIEGRLVAPFSRPGKIICIGLNYRDHAKETGAEIPKEPVVFSKFSNTITSPEAPVVLPSVAHQVDFEAELVAVIGKKAKNVSKSKAFEYIAGYTCGNDVSARDWQKGRPGGQWLMGKTPDTFAPIGPWFVTADEIGDPHDLAISLKLNQVVMQQSRTNELIFGIDELVAHLSQLVTLEPGDLIFTGTPSGVGVARKPPVFLKDGDVVEVEIEGIGVLRNPVIADSNNQ